MEQWKTGKKKWVEINLCGVGLPEGVKPRAQMDVYEANFGDLLAEYSRLLNKPWWRKTPMDRLNIKRMRDALNVITIEWTQ